jgi:hypothetical protein
VLQSEPHATQFYKLLGSKQETYVRNSAQLQRILNAEDILIPLIERKAAKIVVWFFI